MPAQPLPIRKWEEFRDKYNELLRLTLSEKDKIIELIKLLITERHLTLEFLSHLEKEHFPRSAKVKALLQAMKQNLDKAVDRCITLRRIVYKEKDYENDLMIVKLQNMRAWKEQRILKLAERSQYNLHQFNVEADEVKKLNEELREELIKANLIQKYGNVINTIHWNVEMIRELLVMLVEEMKRSYEDIRIMMELEPNTKNETDVRFKDIATYGLK